MSDDTAQSLSAALFVVLMRVFFAIIILVIIQSILYRIFRLITFPIRCVWAVLRLAVTLTFLIPFEILRQLSREWRGIVLVGVGMALYQLNDEVATNDGQVLMDGMRDACEMVKIGWKSLDLAPDR